jgi:hypothetical protein
MMNLRTLYTICFTVSIVCIVLGSMLAISMIWLDHSNEFLWKTWSTIGVVFLASTITMVVTRMFSNRSQAALD